MKHPSVLAFFLWISALAGCVLDLNYDPATEPAIIGCQSNAECPDSANCTLGTCLAKSIPEATYRMRIIPTDTTNLREIDVVDIRFSQRPFMELPPITVPTALKTSGAVRTADGIRVSADIIALAQTDQNAIIRLEASTVFEANRPTFVLSLPILSQTMTGTTRPLFFDFYILPVEDELLPPHVLRAVEATEATPPFFIDLPDLSERQTIIGRIEFDNLDQLPASNLQVMILDEDGRRISTVGKTSADGRFSVAVWSQTDPISATLLIQSTAHNLPRFQHKFTISPMDNRRDLGNFSLGLDEQFFFASGQVLGDGGVKGASLVMRSEMALGTVFAVMPATGANGSFQLQLLPAEYAIQVTPPISSPFGILRIIKSIEDSTPINLRPPLKSTFSGRLRTSAGVAVENARVEAILLEPMLEDERLSNVMLPLATRVTQTTTDVRGAFELLLDPGRYTFKFIPPKRSGLTSFSQEIEFPRTQGMITPFEFIAPLAALLTAQIVDNMDLPLQNQLVELWSQDSGQYVTSGRTNESGYLLLRIPVTNIDQ